MLRQSQFSKSLFVGGIALVALVVVILRARPSEPDVTWDSIQVSAPQQGDAHLILSRSGPTILIDAGTAAVAQTVLLPFLRKHAVTHIDQIFITHPHFDHYGGVQAVIESRDISIKEIIMPSVSRQYCETESPWGCQWADLESLKTAAKERGIPIRPSEEWRETSLGAGPEPMRLRKVYQAAEGKCAVPCSSLNDISILSMLEVGGTKVLFTGDLDVGIGGWLATQKEISVAATILKAPHHGTERTAPDEFFDAVHASVAIVPAPAGLWCSDRSKRIREAFARTRTKVLVNGVHGDIRVALWRDGGFKISPSPQPVAASCR